MGQKLGTGNMVTNGQCRELVPRGDTGHICSGFSDQSKSHDLTQVQSRKSDPQMEVNRSSGQRVAPLPPEAHLMRAPGVYLPCG